MSSSQELEEESLIQPNEVDGPDESIEFKKVSKISIKTDFLNFSKKVNWFVFFLISFYTACSTYSSIAGIWTELPFIVDQLKEGWRLPAILTGTGQVAQLGTVIFMVINLAFPNCFKTSRVIYFILIMGTISTFLLALCWNKTMQVFGQERSVYLLVFNFFLSFLDGLSTVTFVPYLGTHFPKEYITANYIGETLCSMVPTILVMIQEYGTNKDDCNSTNSSNSTSHYMQPNFHVTTYLFLMFLLMVSSIVAFIILNHSWIALRYRKKREADSNENTNIVHIHASGRHGRKERYLLYFLTYMNSFLSYGFMSGLYSYSTMPYGNFYFELTLNSLTFTAPLAIFLTIFASNPSNKKLVLETIIAVLLSAYIIYVSAESPCPIFVNSPLLGGYIMVLAWNISGIYLLYDICLIATKLEKYGEKVLYRFTCCEVFGQVSGSFLIYYLVEVLNVFRDKDKCSTIKCF